MIDVEQLYLKVSDAALKNQAGYMDAAEFNRNLARAQTLLQNFMLSKYDTDGRIHDSLRPFTAKTSQVITAGYTPFPDDFVKEVEVYRRLVSNPVSSGDEPTTRDILCRYLKGHERGSIKESTIRQPALRQGLCFYVFDNGRIEFLPYTQNGYCFIRYIRRPNEAIYAVDIDEDSQIEIYNAGDSVQLEWPEEEEDNFVDIMLFLLGIQIRETELIQFVTGKKQILDA